MIREQYEIIYERFFDKLDKEAEAKLNEEQGNQPQQQ